MRYALRLEAIGDNFQDYRRRFERSNRPFDRRALTAYRFGNESISAQCAKVERGPDGEIRHIKVEGQKDYTLANADGSRGIYFYYALAPGIYAVTEPTALGRARRYLLLVGNDATAEEITKEQATLLLHGGYYEAQHFGSNRRAVY